MLNQLDGLDMFILISLILMVPAAGLTAAAMKKRNSENYFMAGRSLKWWTVAGSIFGTNISVSHLIGMLGIGFSIGFAQSTYELLSIPTILILAYIFIPAYRKLKVFTLSQFLGYRYNTRSSMVYTFLMLMLILVQMIAAFYIGSRTLVLLFHGSNFHVSYLGGIGIIALITSFLTIFGGMQSLVVTDNIQSVMMVITGIIVAVVTFSQPEVHGLSGLLHLDHALPASRQKMHLYLPTNHPDLPWTGVFTGLIALNLFYWTTNQYVVQRALAAKTDKEARVGIIASGFLKLLIPFMCVATGAAAAYVFHHRLGSNATVLPDDAFMKLVETIVPAGYGLKGFILAGLTAATFSSVDSMMNSATTLISIDIYKKYLNKTASDRLLVRFGRLAALAMIIITSGLALLTYAPTSAGNFFLSVSSRASYFTPGIVAVFFLGIVWKKSDGKSAVITMVAAPFIAILTEVLYNHYAAHIPYIHHLFGDQLNFLHRVWITLLCCLGLQVFLSVYFNRKKHLQGKDINYAIDLLISPKIAWKELGTFAIAVLISLVLIQTGTTSSQWMGLPMAIIAFLLFVYNCKDDHSLSVYRFLKDDRLYAGLLSAITVWILYFFA